MSVHRLQSLGQAIDTARCHIFLPLGTCLSPGQAQGSVGCIGQPTGAPIDVGQWVVLHNQLASPSIFSHRLRNRDLRCCEYVGQWVVLYIQLAIHQLTVTDFVT